MEERVLPRSLRRLFDRSWGAVMLNAVWLPSLDRGFGKLWTVDFRSQRAWCSSVGSLQTIVNMAVAAGGKEQLRRRDSALCPEPLRF